MALNRADSTPAYTPRMERLLSVANGKAQDTIGASVIGTEHMLFALASDPEGIAGMVLDELGLRVQIRKRLDEIMASAGYRTPAS